MADSRRMKGTDGKLLSEEHTELIREAESLGIDTFGYKVKGAKLEQLGEKISAKKGGKKVDVPDKQPPVDEKSKHRGGPMKPKPFADLIMQAKQLGLDPFEGGEFGPGAHDAIDKLKLDIQAAKELDLAEAESGQSDEEKVTYTLDDTPETVMVRIHEWVAWLPAHPDPKMPQLAMHDGVTSFQTAKDERLLEVAVSGTGQNYEWDEEEDCPVCNGEGKIVVGRLDSEPGEKDCEKCEGTGTVTIKRKYGMYALQATLARNVDPRIADVLENTQFEPMREELRRDAENKAAGRDRAEDLTIIERGVEQPNRNQRRGGKRNRPHR